MKNGALTFALLVALGAAGGVAFAGCGSDPPPEQVTATDSGPAETAVVTDSKPTDTNPPPVDTGLGCMEPLPSDFACKAPTAKAGQTICNDEAIKALAECFGGDSMKCQAAYMKYTACRPCMFDAWLVNQRFVDTGSCIAKLDPTDKCGQLWQCNIDCQFAVCSEDNCDTTAGSGKTMATSQQDDCLTASTKRGGTTTPKGSCYDKATKPYVDANCPTSNPKTAVCYLGGADPIVRFFRGACRDNGDWSKADIDLSPMGDAGSDTGSDTGGDSGVLPDLGVDLGVDGG